MTASCVPFGRYPPGAGIIGNVFVLLAELHADLFSRHASPLEVYVFVVVANRGEDDMSDEICHQFNGKQQ